MNPNDVPDAVISLIRSISDKPYLRNFESVRENFGAGCPITKKAAEVFISEHRAELEAIGKVLHEFGIGKEVHKKSGFVGT